MGERKGEMGERKGEMGERKGEMGERKGEMGERKGEWESVKGKWESVKGKWESVKGKWESVKGKYKYATELFLANAEFTRNMVTKVKQLQQNYTKTIDSCRNSVEGRIVVTYGDRSPAIVAREGGGYSFHAPRGQK